MTTQLTEDWVRDNQRHLVLAAEAVAARFDARVDEDALRAAEAADALAQDVHTSTGSPVAVERLTSLFRLTGFERSLLIGVAAAELGLPAPTGPVTFGRALATLPDPHWSALLPDSALRGWRLLDLPGQLPSVELGGLSGMPLAVDERLLHALVGADTLDPRLAGRGRLAEPVCWLPERHILVAEQLARLIAPSPGQHGVLLTGEDLLTRRQVVIEAAARLGFSALVVAANDLPDDPTTADALARLLARECGLGTRALLIEASDEHMAPALRLLTCCGSLGVSAALSSDDQAQLPGAPQTTSLHLPSTTSAEREQLFRSIFDDRGLDAGASARPLADHHPLTPAAIAVGVDRAVRAAHPGRTRTSSAPAASWPNGRCAAWHVWSAHARACRTWCSARRRSARSAPCSHRCDNAAGSTTSGGTTPAAAGSP